MPLTVSSCQEQAASLGARLGGSAGDSPSYASASPSSPRNNEPVPAFHTARTGNDTWLEQDRGKQPAPGLRTAVKQRAASPWRNAPSSTEPAAAPGVTPESGTAATLSWASRGRAGPGGRGTTSALWPQRAGESCLCPLPSLPTMPGPGRSDPCVFLGRRRRFFPPFPRG